MNFRKSREAADYIRNGVKQIDARLAILTGTGMKGIDTLMQDAVKIPYSDIPFFPASTVKSHAGECIIGTIEGKQVILFSGRFHYYEGYNIEQIVFPIRVMKQLGVDTVLMTNASGGLNSDYAEGDIVMIADHINLLPRNPLRGKNDERFGTRFPDMLHAYDKGIRDLVKTLLGEQYKEGVYAAMQGPSLETPAEYKFLKTIGADLVGMSTVPEVIAAVHCGLSVGVFAVVSNICYPLDKLEVTTVEDVIAAVTNSTDKLNELIKKVIVQL